MVGTLAKFVRTLHWNRRICSAVLLLVILFLLAGCRLSQERMTEELQMNQGAGDYKGSLTVGELERTYIVHIPSAYDGQRALPLVIVLHGGGHNARGVIRMTGMSDKADKEGFVVVYPEGTSRFKGRLLTWNAGRCCGFAMEQQIDDVGFIRELIEQLQQQLNIDGEKIYVTGASNGAMMAHRLGCELSDKIAAIAPVAGYLALDNCQPTHPLSVITFHGSADKHVPYGGGLPERRAEKHTGMVRSVSESVSFWVEHNGCSLVPLRDESGKIIRERYTDCRDGTEVLLYTVQEGGHAWPGGRKGSPWADEPTSEISATDLVWEFFVQHLKS